MAISGDQGVSPKVFPYVFGKATPSSTEGIWLPVSADLSGNLTVVVGSSTGIQAETIESRIDAQPFEVSLASATFEYLFNGASFDSKRGNQEITMLASAARTASVDSADFTNYNHRGGHFIIDVTALAATPSIVVTIQGKDALSGKYYDLLVGTAITTVGTTVLKVNPGTGAIAGGAANDMLPRTFRVSVVNADADSITYSIGGSFTV